eukprot:Nitzschia sp. Nitz4//scaffold122_size67431//51560//53101//NITZ4_006093-RA/size67431-augustus-gene-0.53-mRNA-1//1//CDS//3329534427//3766//frame0
MDRTSPTSNSDAASSAPSSPGNQGDVPPYSEDVTSAVASPDVSASDPSMKKKKPRKKRKVLPSATPDDDSNSVGDSVLAPHKHKKTKAKQRRDKDSTEVPRKKARKQNRVKLPPPEGNLSETQLAVNEQMRMALEEDQYSANGSIVDTDSDDDDRQFTYKGQAVRLDRNYLIQTARKSLWLERNNVGVSTSPVSGGSSNAPAAAAASANEAAQPEGDDDESRPARGGNRKKKKGRRSKEEERSGASFGKGGDAGGNNAEFERDEGSIFGQTTGSSNSTWVECDKCKKWRRLRGVVDERKLPPKWYCSMNKNDPERARCSAPEEEYDASTTPESAADARTRKHLRVWVRRLQSSEAYEARQPTLTRGKKRAAATSSKDPYEWIRCSNPSCGKWRAILRIMDAKAAVIDRATYGEWYCVMNVWDEKMASCAAPQENLPAVGCPPWVMQDEN